MSHSIQSTIPRRRIARHIASATAACALMLGAAAARADEDAAAAPAGITFSGLVEAGITAADHGADRGPNYGHLFTDRTDQLVLNQAVGTIAKDAGSGDEFGWGFKLQGMYGTDARYTHFLGELDRTIGERTQLDIVEANVTFHVPEVAGGGLDLKVGQYASPLGAETIVASSNPLYSHSYIFNFGLPFKHTGALATLHLSGGIDLYGGVDSGVNTSLGRDGDNNDAWSGIFGFGYANADGTVTLVALTHVGPENASTKAPLGLARANDEARWINDAVLTVKASDALTLITELNYIRDDLVKAEAFGAAQYATWKYDDAVSLTLRTEVFRDVRGFYVAAFQGNQDYVLTEAGQPTRAPVLSAGQGATYMALTAGVTWKPAAALGWDALPDGLALRPEVRYDRSLGDARPFDGDQGQTTFGLDVLIPFGG
ncbi:outer membrane beta-barrel protein [Nitrospirillum sp. BR 11163]|uniref:outer membrane beta-barrel protein n=1 Tax=Nitrospirillum sp. BR 11163 TaxID=3104323 RepID=UPI002AFDF6B5|nr:outer membrane beta-barrel protein [Nitrospirillum sp. BR 11163]MEA1676224.1 outer membrane beta-barrel protein [Nitrospirillum sp. BR 11163]